MDDQLKIEQPPSTAFRRWWGWLSLITVEPTMFLYMMAFMTTSVVEQAFFVHKACTVNHHLSPEVCDDLPHHADINKKVQLTVSGFHQWNNIGGHVVPIILAMFLGSWSDRRGRKLMMLMGLTGKLYYSLMVVVNSMNDSWPLEYVIYTATIPSAFTGADVAIFAAAFSYISDVTTPEQRTLRVSILDVCYLVTMPTGVALGSFLFSNVTGRSYPIMFTVNASLLVLAIMYSLLRLEWQTTASQRPLSEAKSVLGDFFDKEHIIQSVKTMTKKRPQSRRAYLWIFMIIMALYTFQRDEKPMVYLYTQLMFHWDTVTYSNFKTFQSASYVIMMLTGIPVMSKLLGWRDTVIVMIGAAAHASARIVFGLAEVPWLFYVGAAISSLGPVVAPVLRSMASKIVPISERGKVFAFLAVCDNAVPFVSGVLYTQVYNNTIETHPAGIFWLTMATQIAVFILILGIHISLGDRSLLVDEEKVIQPINVGFEEIIEKEPIPQEPIPKSQSSF